MHIGGELYAKLLKLMEEIEHSLLDAGDCRDALAEIIALSKQFCLNHKVSFEFLTSDRLSVEEKARLLQEIYTLVAKLKSEDDSRIKAFEEMSKYR